MKHTVDNVERWIEENTDGNQWTFFPEEPTTIDDGARTILVEVADFHEPSGGERLEAISPEQAWREYADYLSHEYSQREMLDTEWFDLEDHRTRPNGDTGDVNAPTIDIAGDDIVDMLLNNKRWI